MKYRLDPGQIEVVDDDVAEVLRRMTGAQRVQTVFRLHRRALALVEGSVRHFHPDWDEARVWEEILRRFHGGTR